MTSEERREIAAKLRELADGKSPMAECSVYDLYMALGLPYLGTNIEYAVIGYLADLIDQPTCHICDTDHEFEDSVRCNRCRMTFARPWEPFNYCPNCGTRVEGE